MDIGESVNKAFKSINDLKKTIDNADTVEAIESFMEYSIDRHRYNNPVPSPYKSCVRDEALKNITTAYENIMKKYGEKK